MISDTTLIVKHIAGSEPASFLVSRLSDGKSAPAVALVAPAGFPIQGRPDSDLVAELRWYLEGFLDYPFPPETEHAERVLDALREWGQQAFLGLFGSRETGRLFDGATGDYQRLHLLISSDDPRVLSWPWEALRDPEKGILAHTCQIVRQLNQVRDPPALSAQLPRDRVNILLVTARPYRDDVRYRSISRPLVELIEKHRLAAHVDVLRPPTFSRLREHLMERPGHYHILHFDGHGAYGAAVAGQPGHTFGGVEGRLVFETEEGGPDPISAEQLSTLLGDHALPAVVLSACQSAMLDPRAADPFASVAAAFLKSGMRAVVAMAYAVFISGAQRFLPEFYARLFEQGSVAQAVRAGRQKMLEQPGRVCVRGEFPLQDWLVPVLYLQQPFDFSFAREAKVGFVPRKTRLPQEGFARAPYGFVGRDGALLQLERAMRRQPAGIVVHGLGGVGKTTLARGFCQWLAQTDGLEGCLWFSFQEIRSAEHVINRVGEALFGEKFALAPLEQRLNALERELKQKKYVLVWDNFEAVRGIAGTSVAAQLCEEDQRLLAEFLLRLRGGATKVLITSRNKEEWLDPQRRYLLPLGGLQGEERWEYCGTILADLGLRIDRSDKDLGELMKLLRGHPLAMRVVLPRLEKMTAAQVWRALQENLAELGLGADPEQDALMATLRFVGQSLPPELRPLLVPLSLYEGYVDGNLLELMGRQVEGGWTRERIDELLAALVGAGLVWSLGQGLYEMHPVLTGYLRSDRKEEQAHHDMWTRAFVDVMGSWAALLAHRQWHEQQESFHLHWANFHSALREAERLSMDADALELMQALALCAFYTHNFKTAEVFYGRMAEYHERRGEQKKEATVYHQLSVVASGHRDFGAAEHRCGKALAIFEKLNIESGMAICYQQMGMISMERNDLGAAEHWYLKALSIFEKLGNAHLAPCYTQIGIIAEKKMDFTSAKEWYRKALSIFEKLGNDHCAAVVYNQLGIIAREQKDFSTSERWHFQSLTIHVKQDNDYNIATSYHQIGRLREEQGEHAVAEQWYYKSLAISEKQGYDLASALSYHQLGRIAQEKRDFDAAKQWYRKSLTISEQQGNEHGAASTYLQMGILDGRQEHYEDAGRWFIKSILAFGHAKDERNAATAAHSYRLLHNDAPPAEQQKLQALWTQAGLALFQNPLHDAHPRFP